MGTEAAEEWLSFEDYLKHANGTDNRYELIDGELVPVPPPTIRHLLIAKLIEQLFDSEIKRLQLPWVCLREAGIRTGARKSRLMDVCVATLEQTHRSLDRPAVFEVPPLLAVEIVSEESVKRDYRYKRSEYAAVEIPEYWIVDPLQNKVSVLVLVEGLYEDRAFKGEARIVSGVFEKLAVTADQVLSAGKQ